MKITTLNLNGLRSSLHKGLLDFIVHNDPDVLLLQEVRASPAPELLEALGYHSVWMPALKAGYSGVALASKQKPLEVVYGLDHPEYDAEGRFVMAELPGVRVGSVYVPSGSSGEVRYAFKLRFHEHLLEQVAGWLDAGHGPVVLGGDFNVAHRPVDLKNWKANGKNSGFTPPEREWLTRFLGLGLTDAHRTLLGERAEYTWWSTRGNAYASDVGWRLDYQFCRGMVPLEHTVHREQRLSDHAALSVLYAPL